MHIETGGEDGKGFLASLYATQYAAWPEYEEVFLPPFRNGETAFTHARRPLSQSVQGKERRIPCVCV